ncbi:N-carbamoyl-L-amino-acid hydrolase [Motilibacter peucedani]|uniref:N-carbamoyl-L-amino-acid hydrolase n=1 Tax=Motilibacter peucedani TaxID=598650 RepID=A0A420XQV6_9ACTN|nr:allantoate amidohydrolase [Motilibacter peucedani]RKS75660.1 N-carbamoyl-L-amino-acid hydrolase [Motilibacter peucedani]
MGFDALWAELEPVGRASSGGYRRYAWTPEDRTLREWFTSSAAGLGLDVTTDRAGNLWAWWGSPDTDGPGVVMGSHLDSVPDGGAFDGPLGVVSAFAALESLRDSGFSPAKPIGVACFGDEEGARFGIACAGSRLLTGVLDADRARGLRDGDGVTMAEAMSAAGVDPARVGRDDETLRRVAHFVELHVEQGRGLVHSAAAVGVGSSIWPHGRWRVDLAGRADHAGTTALVDRDDPMLELARLVTSARTAAERRSALATVGKVLVSPNGVNAIPSRVTAWLDARASEETAVRAVVADLAAAGLEPVEESWTPRTPFDRSLAVQLSALLQGAPVLETGAGHDAGVLAQAGIPTAMLFVRNPTGVSHSPEEHAEPADCHAGVEALASVVRALAGHTWPAP